METQLPVLHTATDIRKTRTVQLSLKEPYRSLFGHLPRNSAFNILIYGAPGTGKSTFSLRFAEILAKSTNTQVLYNVNEEPIESGTLLLRLNLVGVSDKRIKFYDSTAIADTEVLLATGLYKYCILDSLNNFNVPDSHILALRKKFPTVSFVFCGQVEKGGKHRGAQEWQHMVDAVYRTERDENGIRTINLEKSRYGATLKQMEIFRS